jgi:hypothetical protein
VPRPTGTVCAAPPPNGAVDGWEAGLNSPTIHAVARLVILWTRPYHLTAEEAATWARREVGRLLGVDAIGCAQLTRLRSASPGHARDWDWMLEIGLSPGATAEDCVNAAVFTEWLGDLHLLGMRPSVMVADDGTQCREGR